MSDHEDMISAVRASVDQLSEKEAPESATPEKVEAAPEKAETTESASERARDEKGRFVASDATEKPVTKETIAAPEAPEATQAAPSTAPTVKPPSSWPAEAKATFAQLPPAVQQAVLKREDEMAKGSQQYSDERQRLKMLEGVIAPRRDYFKQNGFKSDAEAINHLFTLSDGFNRDPAGTLRFLAQHYNVDLTRLSGGTQPAAQQSQPQQQFFQQPPNIEAQIQEAIDTRFARMTVQEFEASPPEHYQEVKPLMQMLLQNAQATDLQDAYDKSIWMNPDIRTKILEAQRAEEEQKRVTAQAAKIDKKVKASNASLNGAPHGLSSAPPKTTGNRGQFGEVADDVRAAISALM